MRLKAAAGTALAVLVLAGCGEEGEEISRSTFKGQWPFTVDSGVLRCEGTGGSGAVTFTTDGTTYGVNGTALTQGLPRADPIWRRDPQPEVPGVRVNIGDVLDHGLELCK